MPTTHPPLSTILSTSPSNTESIARAISPSLRPGDTIALDGDLGAGKTCFTRGLVSGLPGSQNAHVRSPTFAILNVYPTTPPTFHFDFYRLTDIDDLETTGYWDIANRRDGVIIVEWCMRIPDAFDDDTLFIEIAASNANQRILTLRGSPDRFGDMTRRLDQMNKKKPRRR